MACNTQIKNRASRKNNYTKYNQQTYVQHVFICNQMGDPVEISVPSIREISIEEDIFDWFITGTITFADRFNVFQKGAMKLKENDDKSPQYKFRGDGKDILTIDIWPNWQSDDEKNAPQVLDTTKWDMWLFHGDFAVYDVEDVSSNDNDYKMYKLYFWSEAYQQMLDKNIEWSTANSSYVADRVGKTPLYLLNNEQRSIRTGEAVVDLLTKAGFESHLAGDPKAPDNFDLGDKDATIFYTSPSQNTIADDLAYLTRLHVGEANQDICWLAMDRSTEETGEQWKFSMTPLSDIFKKAGNSAWQPGENQIEHFFVYENGPQTGALTIPMFKAPYMAVGKDRDLKITHVNTIYSYKFVDMAGLDNSKAFVAKPTHHFAGGAKQFTVDFWDNKPSVAKQYIIDNYISQLYSKSKDPMITFNKPKLEALHIEPVYSTHHTLAGRKADGRNKLIHAGILLNACISFGAFGLLSRQPGKFIAIDRMHGDTDNDFDNRLLGQWFVTTVQHVFTMGKYANHITAVKIHNFNTKIQLPEDLVE